MRSILGLRRNHFSRECEPVTDTTPDKIVRICVLTLDADVDCRSRQDCRGITGVHSHQQEDEERPEKDNDSRRNGKGLHGLGRIHDRRPRCREQRNKSPTTVRVAFALGFSSGGRRYVSKEDSLNSTLGRTYQNCSQLDSLCLKTSIRKRASR